MNTRNFCWNLKQQRWHLPEYYPIGRLICQGPCRTKGLRRRPSFPSMKADVFEVRRTKCGNVSKILRNLNFPGNHFCEVARRPRFELHVTKTRKKNGVEFSISKKNSSNRSLSDLFVVLEWPLPIFRLFVWTPKAKSLCKKLFRPMGQFDKGKKAIFLREGWALFTHWLSSPSRTLRFVYSNFLLLYL